MTQPFQSLIHGRSGPPVRCVGRCSAGLCRAEAVPESRGTTNRAFHRDGNQSGVRSSVNGHLWHSTSHLQQDMPEESPRLFHVSFAKPAPAPSPCRGWLGGVGEDVAVAVHLTERTIGTKAWRPKFSSEVSKMMCNARPRPNTFHMQYDAADGVGQPNLRRVNMKSIPPR